jgi:hypothetical protein
MITGSKNEEGIKMIEGITDDSLFEWQLSSITIFIQMGRSKV